MADSSMESVTLSRESSEEVSNAELMVSHQSLDTVDAIDALARPELYPRSVYFSMRKPADTAPQSVKLAYASAALRMQSKADFRAAECVNEKINLVHILAHRVRIRNVDTDTGEVTFVPADRLVLLDDEGKTYECVSQGLMQSVLLLVDLMGQPSSWTEPIPVTIRNVSVRGTWSTLKLEIWEDKRALKK